MRIIDANNRRAVETLLKRDARADAAFDKRVRDIVSAVRRGGDETIAGADDLVHARHARGAVGERGDCMRAAHAEHLRHTGFERRRHHSRLRPRAHDHDLAYAGDARRHGGHE